MKCTKKIIFFLITLILPSLLFAQNSSTILTKTTKIQQEVSFSSKIYSKPNTREVKMPNGQTATVNNIGGSKLREYFRVSEVVIKPIKDQITISIKTKRIKNNGNGREIDTDIPFANDPQTQASLDHYFSQLGEDKLSIANSKIQSPKPLEETVWNGPLLNPVYELSGVLLSNTMRELHKGDTWQDTIKGQYNAYINHYEIVGIVGDDATISLSGYLEKIDIQTIAEGETSDFDKLIKSEENEKPKIEPKIVINVAKYSGKMTVSTKNLFIKEMTILMNREETKSMFGMAVPQTLETSYTIKNKML